MPNKPQDDFFTRHQVVRSLRRPYRFAHGQIFRSDEYNTIKYVGQLLSQQRFNARRISDSVGVLHKKVPDLVVVVRNRFIPEHALDDGQPEAPSLVGPNWSSINPKSETVKLHLHSGSLVVQSEDSGEILVQHADRVEWKVLRYPSEQMNLQIEDVFREIGLSQNAARPLIIESLTLDDSKPEQTKILLTEESMQKLKALSARSHERNRPVRKITIVLSNR